MRTYLTVVVDNEGGEGLKPSWGLSIYIERGNLRILFDTGDDPDILKENTEKLGIDLSALSYVIISHNHHDHTGGFLHVKEKIRNIPVYIPEKKMVPIFREFGFKPVYADNVLKIEEGFTLYRFNGRIPEQSLLIEGNGKYFLVVGCSHPKIEDMVYEIVKSMNIELYGVIGGFHLYTEGMERLEKIKEKFISLNIKEVYPIHCTGKRAREYFKENLKGIYKGGREGTRIEI